MEPTLGFEVSMKQDYEDALEMVEAALQEEGFGILTRIDVKATFKEKIGEDFRPYAILGACNPNLAHRALVARAEVGMLLPCNVTVEEAPQGGCLVRILDPKAMMSFGDLGDDEVILGVAKEARERMERVVAALGG